MHNKRDQQNESNVSGQNNNGQSDLHRNPQKVKMIYKKQINSHRATSTSAVQVAAAAHRDAQNIQHTQRAGQN